MCRQVQIYDARLNDGIPVINVNFKDFFQQSHHTHKLADRIPHLIHILTPRSQSTHL